ncbi:MAG: NapC/NirT family cytochrome c [Alphaproteobacteria bacterium]|nr:NapC/NirT family cytochrome c [Alphaproteobacteria bacterium]
MTKDPSQARGFLASCWRALWKPSVRYSFGAIFAAGGIAGVIFWGGFNTFMEYTNTMEFCVSCHEMEQLVYPEYQKSVHFKNPSGVRVVCSDCHVPKDWTAKLIRKIQASGEVYHKLMGTIDTPEKFEAKRRVLAERVWKTMTENNSKECRNCHDYKAMAFHKQSNDARQKMEGEAAPANKPCIECHKGIAHKFPLPPRDD